MFNTYNEAIEPEHSLSLNCWAIILSRGLGLLGHIREKSGCPCHPSAGAQRLPPLCRESYLRPNAVKFAAARTANFSHPDALAGFVKAQDNQIIIITHLRPPVFALCTINVPAGSRAGEAARACLDNLPAAAESKAPSRRGSQQMSQRPNLLICSLCSRPVISRACRGEICTYIVMFHRDC